MEIIEGDALKTVESIDFVFIDAIKEEYLFYLSMVWPKVQEGGLVVADNMISHETMFCVRAYKGFNGLMDVAISVTVPIGSGDEFTYKLE